jgi:hypothetical protein
MEKPSETTTPDEGKHSFNRGFVVWPVVIFTLYALSYGPVERNQEKKHKNAWFLQLSAGMYVPLGWVYRMTPLHKPMGMYYHLWLPKYFDAKGDLI